MTPDADDTGGADWAPIPMDPAAVYEAIATGRRRIVILSVARAGEAVPISDLAEQIAAIENGVPPSDVEGRSRTNVYVTLSQNHLNKLDDLGAAEIAWLAWRDEGGLLG